MRELLQRSRNVRQYWLAREVRLVQHGQQIAEKNADASARYCTVAVLEWKRNQVGRRAVVMMIEPAHAEDLAGGLAERGRSS